MKKLLTLILVVAMAISIVACGANGTTGTTATTAGGTTTEPSKAPDATTAVIAPGVNEGSFKAGVYTATSSYATEGMNMTWNFVLTLKADGTFTMADGKSNTEKGAGTYALTGDCYTLTYSDERTSTFVVQKDGTLRMTKDLPYGIATIQLALVGDIVFSFSSDVPADGGESGGEGGEQGGTSEVYTLAAGAYGAEYKKESAMAGTVVYSYTATIGADGTFAYSVKFPMGGTMYDGVSANGTYKVEGNKFTFTDSEGNVTEGTLTAENTLKISLKASAMAKDPYEVTFTPAVSE